MKKPNILKTNLTEQSYVWNIVPDSFKETVIILYSEAKIRKTLIIKGVLIYLFGYKNLEDYEQKYKSLPNT